MTQKTETPILISAMHTLARDIQSGDGVANGAIREAAHRLQEQFDEITRLTGEAKVLRDLLGEASEYIDSNEVEPVDFQAESELLDKIAKAIRGTV